MNIAISNKVYSGIYRKIKGSDLKNDIQLYNDVFISSAERQEEMFYFVFTNDEHIQTSIDYLI